MKLIKEDMKIVSNPQDEQYYYNNSIPSKFDKWLGWDCGPVEYQLWEDEDNKEKHPEWYEGIYEETWNYVGRQPDGRYYFICNGAPYGHKDRIGRVISTKTFHEATYMIAFPGRGY